LADIGSPVNSINDDNFGLVIDRRTATAGVIQNNLIKTKLNRQIKINE
jgi:hypothetical protein